MKVFILGTTRIVAVQVASGRSREPTLAEVREAFRKGDGLTEDGTLFFDEPGWPYDLRFNAVTHRGMGLV